MNTLTEPELGIMQVLWEAEEAIPRSFIQERLAHLGWKANTFNTYLNRLQNKGFIQRESRGRAHYYRPLVSRQAYQQKEGESLLNRLFQGSLKSFVLSVSHTDAVGEDELEELRAALGEMKEGQGDGK